MDTETDNLIQEQLKTLPENLQKAINAVPWKSEIKEIAILNKLSIEQVELAERETMLIIYGFEDPRNFIQNLATEVGINEALATTIATDVNEKILKVIDKRASETEIKTQGTLLSVPGIPPHNLPAIEEGEVAHSVPHVEEKNPPTGEKLRPHSEIKPENKAKPVLAPVPSYSGNPDPYREPL